jgi:hypothetical protein
MKKEAQKQVLHVIYGKKPKCNSEKVNVLTLTIQLSSFTITQLDSQNTARMPHMRY